MSDFIDRSHVFLDCPATTRDEALAFIASKAVELGIASDEQAVLTSFKERENAGSTGMIGGFAIPHAKSDDITSGNVIVVKFASDLDWKGTQDGAPIRVAIALLAPASDPQTHLQLLAQVATMIVRESFRTEMLEAQDVDDVAKIVSAGLDA